MDEEFDELFVVPYEGKTSVLVKQINSLSGIQSVSLDTTHEEVSSELACDIRYDTHKTDRTRIAQQLEGFEGTTGEVTFG